MSVRPKFAIYAPRELRLWLTIGVICGSLVTNQALASTSTRDRANEVNVLLRANESLVTDERRKAIALALAAYWDAFAARIPRLSPPELQWIKGEVDSENADRFIAIMDRREFALYSLLDNAQICRSKNTELAGMIGKDSQREALQWVITLHCYRDTAVATRQQLQKVDLIPTQEDAYQFAVGDLPLWQIWIIDVAVKSALFPPLAR